MNIRHTMEGNHVLVLEIDAESLDAANVRGAKERLTALIED